MAVRGPELSIVVPVLNERANIVPLVQELSGVLSGIEWEIIFVDDDSRDATAAFVRDFAADHGQVRIIQRIGRRGLSSACIEGMLGSTAPYLAVMDGDLQHDPHILPTMLDVLKQTDAELAIGSRYVAGGGTGDFDAVRVWISRCATWLGRSMVPPSLKDPMSGYFMLKRALFDRVVRDLSGLGFKILLDIFASSPRPVAFREVPFTFRTRQSGESKLDSLVAWEYLMLLADKLIGRWVPIRFVSFILIGALGLCVHLAVVKVSLLRLDFTASQTLATVIAMVFNYSLNNVLTYRDQRKRGWRWFTGLMSFMAVCGVGAIANVGIAAYVFGLNPRWVLASIAGVLTGAVWNYAVTSVYTWGRSKR